MQRLEHLFFAEAPSALRWLAGGLVLAGLVGGLVLAYHAGAGFAPRHMLIALYLWLPAALLWALAWAVATRHPVVVPLSVALCVISLFTLTGVPTAMDGITGPLSIRWMPWLLGAVEIALIICFLAFILRLWKTGALNKGKS